MTHPLRPEHADREYRLFGHDSRFTARRVLDSYAYAANGNLHNPTPHYRWLLLVDGRPVDSFHRRHELFTAVKCRGEDYLAEFPEKGEA